jgi:uncharacterized DUF497 family protein
MDFSYSLNEIEFEWDQRKASANLRKHRVSFEAACEFTDDMIELFERSTKTTEDVRLADVVARVQKLALAGL